jgi:sulfite reductase alpha subunit-like flavoprotein
LECLSPLKPCLVPIASSSLERSQPLLFTAQPESEAPNWGRVESRQQAKFRAGEWLTVSVDRVSYPAYPLHDDLEPILVIADGPGIAWARSLVAERRARQAKGRTWVIATGMASLQFPFSRTLATWYASGSVGRFDVASGVEPADAVELLKRVEDQIWRWIVDHSRVLLVSTRQPMRDAIEHWFVALLAQRSHLDSESAHQRHRELVEQNRWAVLPSAPAAP